VIDVVTYYSTNTKNPDETWVGYIVMPKEGKQLTIRFSGRDEQTVIDRATAFWNTRIVPNTRSEASTDDDLSQRGKRFAGSIWLYNRVTGERVRASREEVEAYLAKGFTKGRS
jgi:hypothetical protein